MLGISLEVTNFLQNSRNKKTSFGAITFKSNIISVIKAQCNEVNLFRFLFLQFLKSNILSLQKMNKINLYQNQKAKHVISD